MKNPGKLGQRFRDSGKWEIRVAWGLKIKKTQAELAGTYHIIYHWVVDLTLGFHRRYIMLFLFLI